MKATAFATAFFLASSTLILAATESRTGVWTAEARDSKLHFTLLDSHDTRSHWGNMTSFTLPLARFEGLTQAEYSSFTLKSPAGTITFRGYFSDGEGAGHFQFVASDAFRQEMARLGYPDIKEGMALVFATHDFSPEVVRQLRVMGYDISVRQLEEIAIFGISPQVVHDYEAMGFSRPSLKELIDLRVGNVDAAYVQAIRGLGFAGTDPHEVAETAILGVTTDYARQMKKLFGELTFHDLRDMRIGNVTPASVAEFRAAGYPDLSAKQLAEFGIQHVTPAYIVEMRKLGYDKLTPRQLVEMRIFNLTPEYVRRMNAIGINDMRRMIELKTTGAADVLLKNH